MSEPSSIPARDLALQLQQRFVDQLSGPEEFRGEFTLRLADSSRVVEVCRAARELGFDFLLDISSVDNYGQEPRFEVVYELYSLAARSHLRLKFQVAEEPGSLPSVIGVWKTADWHEREIYDMMGLRFEGHPDLRRILMWDGYPHFPLRKDFPLAGKSTDEPAVAFTDPAPLDGGPFVTIAGGRDSVAREPRVRLPEADTLSTNARLERRRDLGRADEQQPDPAKK